MVFKAFGLCTASSEHRAKKGAKSKFHKPRKTHCKLSGSCVSYSQIEQRRIRTIGWRLQARRREQVSGDPCDA
eukprot:9717870-Karenia_brevis.AAC.1